EPHPGLCPVWCCRLGHHLPARHAVQLDGVAGRSRRHDLHHGGRQGDRHVDADHAVLLHGLRAFGGEHVPVPLRHDHGRRLLGDGLHDLERNPHRAGQPGGRPGLYRTDAVHHPRTHRAQTHPAAPGGMTPAAQARPVSGRVAPSARLDIALGQASDRGRKAVNQDYHGACVPAEPQLSAKGAVAVLADGISSSAVSHIASQTAVAGFLADYYCTPDAWSVRKSAQRVLAATNAWLHAQTRRDAPGHDADRGYVCTFSALIIKSATAYLFHVGDARIYRLRRTDLEQLTRDHRLQVSAEHSYLARALGIGPHLEIDHLTLGIERGDLFLLATDGVHEYLDPQWLLPLLAEHHSDLNAAAQRIVEQALALGSADNLTVQLVRIDNLPPLAMAEHSGQLADLPPAPLLESRAEFDGFTVERELHASSRSHVYLVTDRESGNRLVLKVPSIDQRQDSQYLE